MDSFGQQSTNGIEVAATAIEFSSLYPALQRNYEENSVPSVITQLLRIYQPEDDIMAYERVLKKVQDLLEGCDSHTKHLLLSMIPVPKNASDHRINDVFRTITGFAKLDLQENDVFENTFDNTNTNGIAGNSILPLKQNFSCDKSTSDSRLSLAEGFPFRGFAESEISTTFRSHVRNVKRLYGITDRGSPPDLEILIDVSSNSARRINRQAKDPSSDNSKKCSDGNNQYQATTYRQYLLNKRYYAPAGISNTNGSHLRFSSQTVYQDACSARDDTEITADKIPRQLNDVRHGSKKCDDINVYDKDVKSDVLSRAIIDIGQNATTVKQTIKDKIRRMDICCNENHDIVIDADDLLAAVGDGLKKSLRNFLKRAQEGTSIELSAFPRTRLYPRTDSSIYFTSKDQKPIIARKVSERAVFASGNGKSCLLLQQQNANVSSGRNSLASCERTRALPYIAGAQTGCGPREVDKATESSLFQDNSDCVTVKKAVMVRCKQDDVEESMYGCKMIGARSKIDVNSQNEARSMSEIAAYKKRCYNTLLSVQRAKVAVTNSLASSSERLTTYDDPYYPGYACQRQHLFRRQRRCVMGPQFSSTCPPTALSGLAGAHGDQYSWARSDCKYLLLKQLRLRRQTSPFYARNQDGWIHRYVGSMYSCPFALNGRGRTKRYIRRKSLEDIVGKLKDMQ